MWRIRFSAAAEKAFGNLDAQMRRRIADYLDTRVAPEPRRHGKPMRSDQRAWRYRLGAYRIVCDIDDKNKVVYVVRLGHRSSVYE